MDLIPASRSQDLQVVLRTRDHVVCYNPSSQTVSAQSSRSGALTSATHRDAARPSARSNLPPVTGGPASNITPQVDGLCPTCLRPWLSPFDFEQPVSVPAYFKLLHNASVPPSREQSRPSTPPPPLGMESGSSTPVHDSKATKLQDGAEIDGYYSRFFVEKKKLGHGARGTVYLCQHVLNGNKLGDYAVKKIPVGQSSEFLLRSLNEVHLLESLRHENIIHYQHAWIESCRPSPFSPLVPVLHVLMAAANGGSLADWLSARSGDTFANSARSSENGSGRDGVSLTRASKTELLKNALRQRRAKRAEKKSEAITNASADRSTSAFSSSSSPPPQSDKPFLPQDLPAHTGVGVHFLREEEVLKLFSDVTSGLGFLHQKNVLHLDLKPANVLLHWDDEAEPLLPRAMLSDFGSSVLLKENWTRKRSGNTGTLEYVAPEMLVPEPSTGIFPEMTFSADQWGLGLILHLLIFLRLPYSQIDDIPELRNEMLSYAGYRIVTPHPSASLNVLTLLAQLLSRDPLQRPSCAEVLRRLASPDQTLPNRKRSQGHTRDADPPSSSAEVDFDLPVVRRPPMWKSPHSSAASTISRQAGESPLTPPMDDGYDSSAVPPSPPYRSHSGQHRLGDSSRLSILDSEPSLWSRAGVSTVFARILRSPSTLKVSMAALFCILQVFSFDQACASSGPAAAWTKYGANVSAMLVAAVLSQPSFRLRPLVLISVFCVDLALVIVPSPVWFCSSV